MKNIPSYIFAAIVLSGNFLFFSWALTEGYQETMDTAAFIAISFVLGGIGLATLAGICHEIAASRKGKISIVFDNKVYNSGDTLSGTITLHAKKELKPEKLTVCFFCEVRRRREKGDYWETIWKRELDVLQEQRATTHIFPGTHTYPFSFEIPESVQDKLPFENHILGQLAKMALQGSKHWRISVDLDLPGANLMDKCNVRVNS